MAEAKSANIGSASHLGDNQLPRDAHFIHDYTRRRVPMPVISYMAVADSPEGHPTGETASKKALSMLDNLIEPAVLAEEDLNSPHMEPLIKDAFAQINASLLAEASGETGSAGVSLTVVIADAKKAYIGHVGNTRVYLFHDERLYDLTPTGELSAEAAPSDHPLHLFKVSPDEETPERIKAPPAEKGEFLGISPEAKIGYNEVEIVPGDTIILCTDGLWKNISEEEIVENLLSALNVQRSTSQLTRMAFSRDSSDNATMTAWQYVVPGEAVGADPRELRRNARKERVAEGLIVTLLILVLLGIFAVGFAFGWRITDSIRKPQKEAASVSTETADEEIEEKESEKEKEEEEEKKEEQQPAPETLQTATIQGQGVRMRVTPDAHGEIVGLLRDGQQVTVQSEVMGTDSKTWSKAKGTVRSEGEDIEAEGYIRNDFLKSNPGASTPADSSPTPADSSP